MRLAIIVTFGHLTAVPGESSILDEPSPTRPLPAEYARITARYARMVEHLSTRPWGESARLYASIALVLTQFENVTILHTATNPNQDPQQCLPLTATTTETTTTIDGAPTATTDQLPPYTQRSPEPAKALATDSSVSVPSGEPSKTEGSAEPSKSSPSNGEGTAEGPSTSSLKTRVGGIVDLTVPEGSIPVQVVAVDRRTPAQKAAHQKRATAASKAAHSHKDPDFAARMRAAKEAKAKTKAE